MIANITKTCLVAVFLVSLLGHSYADHTEPFGIHTVALKSGRLVEIWRNLKQQLYSADVARLRHAVLTTLTNVRPRPNY